MARVLVTGAVDDVRRAAIAERSLNAFEIIVLEDLSAADRDSAWSSADVLLTEGFRPEIPEDLASRAPRLRMVQIPFAGVSHVPFESIPGHVLVCSNAGAFNASVAEHAMALLLSAAKDVVRRTEEIRRGVFDQHALSQPLSGATLLVLGYGGIGSEVARLARSFGMRIAAIGRAAEPPPDVDAYGGLGHLPRLLSEADAVLVALPLTRATEGLIDAAALATMKADAVLVNVARGKIVVEDDLYEHLRTHPGFRAALDVWWSYPEDGKGHPFRRPFHELPNVIMTPHVAFANPDQRRRSIDAALDNVERFLRDGRPRNVVDRREYR